MSRLQALPTGRLLADYSLWSADLANLANDVRRTEPFADVYHLDVADGQFVPSLLFFPDLVSALRPLTPKPFHVHLMTLNPARLIDDFAEAGADVITVHLENPELPAALEQIRARGLSAGIAIQLETPVEAVLPYLDQIEVIVMMGTKLGIKGVGLADEACPRITALSRLLTARGLRDKIKISADGGIREQTVPRLRAAGADMITPGSLAFKSPNLFETTLWLHALPRQEG
ncbi:ribulose-phosphate 3-epimerase [Candidatus Flexifilum breve]|uniref:ribulose-phosphate 3-epimerase n=1 Tax=Candidatus Flexifilum breve TaxID=3140694 RepID=UPI0031CC8E77